MNNNIYKTKSINFKVYQWEKKGSFENISPMIEEFDDHFIVKAEDDDVLVGEVGDVLVQDSVHPDFFDVFSKEDFDKLFEKVEEQNGDLQDMLKLPTFSSTDDKAYLDITNIVTEIDTLTTEQKMEIISALETKIILKHVSEYLLQDC